ncbi:MAG: GMC family oxidoreductase [Rhodothermales bacterium]|nr:GMC family oxidoreductase [Rhodothermales bacterium]
MHTDARTLENGSIIEGDLCIIGAGAAGISMALEWQNAGRRVILLEGGGFDVEYAMQDLYTGESVGQPYFPLQSSRLHYFGGTTGHWGGWSSDYDPQDFEKRDWVPNSGWPISRADLEPFYRRACPYVEVGRDTFDPAVYQAEDPELVELPLDKSSVWAKMWQLSPPTRFGNVYRDAIVQSENIHLLTYANVGDIRTNEAVSRVEHVEIRSHDGNAHTVRARHFVLAGGAIQNARLLLAANTQAPKGLGNDADVVGRYFMEHLELIAARMILTRPLPMKLYTTQFGVTRHFAEVAITAAKQRELRILNGTSALRAQAAQNAAAGVTGFSADAVQNVRDRQERLARVQNQAGAPTQEAPRTEYVMQVRMEQAPNPDSRIMLSDQRDALGMPRVKLDWRIGELEKRSIRQLHETFAAEVGKAGIGRVQLSDWLLKDEPMWPANLGAGWHHMGTTRMDPDPKQGVVDVNCTVHGLSNLHVAGSAVFPTAGAANPTLTLLAMTLRLSDHLKGMV